jgi:transketolase
MPPSKAHLIRRAVLEQSKRAHIGHIGSSLSVIELIAMLLDGALDFDRGAGGADRDRFVLSKGHAALAWYCGLAVVGRLTQAQLETFGGDGTLLAGHPEHVLDGVDFCTGSLGQGLSIGAGAALAGRLQRSARRIVVLLSDAECNEGSVWEAAMFAAQHGLDNLTLLVDVNGQQALGYTEEVLDLGSVEDKFAQFGWDAATVLGHDHVALGAALGGNTSGRPRAVVASTTFGYGVSFMESKIEWHYLPLNEETYPLALADLQAGAPA